MPEDGGAYRMRPPVSAGGAGAGTAAGLGRGQTMVVAFHGSRVAIERAESCNRAGRGETKLRT